MSSEQSASDTYQRCTTDEWEKKAELALMNGNTGGAMKFAHYANLREADSETDRDGEVSS